MTIKLDANPKMIKWARENAGFTLKDLPDCLKDAGKWESGEDKPTWDDLRNMAKEYKRPTFYYFFSKPPKEDDLAEYSPDLRLEIRSARLRRDAYIKIHEDMGITIPQFNSCKEKLRQYFRDTHNLEDVLFNMGMLVFETSDVSEAEFSGCLIYYDICPIILLNGENNHNQKISTLIHLIRCVCGGDKNSNKTAGEILTFSQTIHKSDLKMKSESSIVLKRNGVPFTKLVLEAYENKIITPTQAMRYLDTSLDNINLLIYGGVDYNE